MKKIIYLLCLLFGITCIAQEPTVTNVTATAIGSTTATVNYTANTFGTSTTRQVSFMASNASTFTNTPSVNVTNNAPTTYSINLTGLDQNRRYRARVLVLPSDPNLNAGTGEVTFLTTGSLAVPILSNLSTSNVTSNSVNINYSLNPNGSSLADVGISIEAGATSLSIGGVSGVSGTTTTAYNKGVTGLAPNTTYTYYLFASNGLGDSPVSSGTFTTLAGNASGPSSPNPSATSITQGSASISYSIVPNGVLTTSTVNYGISPTNMNLTATAPSSSMSGTSSIAILANLTSLLPSTTYFYQVFVSSSNGSSSSTIRTFTTSPGTPPSLSANTATNTSNSATSISFMINPNGSTTVPSVRYGTSPTTMNTVVSGTSVSGNTAVSQTIILDFLQANTTYYYVVQGNSSGSPLLPATGSAQFTRFASGNPILSANSVTNIGTSVATINFTVNANGAATSSITVSYRPLGTFTVSNVTVANVTGNTDNVVSASLTGLIANQTYEYFILANNSAGGTQFPSGVNFFQFITLASAGLSNQMLYHFPFNGNMTSVTNPISLTSTATQIYSATSLGANQALNLSIADTDTARATAPTALLNLIPAGSNQRSVSIRVKFINQPGGFGNFPFFYGTASNGKSFSFEQTDSNAVISGWGSAFTNTYANAANVNIWYNMVVTYDGAQSNLYIDGVNIGAQNLTLNTVGQNFFLGRTSLPDYGRADSMAIDDLRIYNYALSQSQVSALNATLSNESFNSNNLKFSLYPNPATNLVNIDLATELKSIEIYSLQGQKVLSSNKNQVDVSGLSKGMYLVRVEDVENGVSTQKLVVN